MPVRRDLCRNFQQGSCRYGERCKFVHTTQQQQKPNAFGFGSQTGTPFQQTSSQQQKPNPFGFGVQNSAPTNDRGGFKPFDNKWVRPGQAANQSQAAQSQSTHHECTDAAVCKRLIAEDFRNESPLWKLTCYGHYKELPCDITGDISYEELRAEAYSDAKRGLSIHAIVEREKNLEKSKLIECENFIRNPYTKHTQTVLSNHSPFPAVVNATSPSLAPQNTGPSPFSSISPQQGSSPNMSFGVRLSTPSNNAFAPFHGSSSSFGTTSMPSGSFGTQVSVATGQTSFPVQTSANPFPPNPSAFGNGGMNTQGNQAPSGNFFTSNLQNLSSNSGQAQQIQTPAVSQPPVLSNALSDTISADQRHMVQKEVLSADASIWSKVEWKLGEIPEQPPPAAFVR